MDGEFWAGAGRDLALLLAGGILTLLGGWMSNRAAARREREARAATDRVTAAGRNRDAIERVRALTFDMYLEGRAWEEVGEGGTLRFDERRFHDAQLSTELIADPATRARLRQTFLITRNAERMATGLTGPYSSGRTRTSAMYHATRILSAYLRGEEPDENDLRFLENQARFASKRTKSPIVDVATRQGLK